MGKELYVWVAFNTQVIDIQKWTSKIKKEKVQHESATWKVIDEITGILQEEENIFS